jgi:hypothetical protein
MGWIVKVSEFESQHGQDFPVFHVIQTGSGAHQASYPMGIGVLSLAIKQPGHEADHSPPASTKGQEYMDLYIHSPIDPHDVVLN